MADLVLNPIQYHALQYRHPNRALDRNSGICRLGHVLDWDETRLDSTTLLPVIMGLDWDETRLYCFGTCNHGFYQVDLRHQLSFFTFLWLVCFCHYNHILCRNQKESVILFCG